MTRKRVFLALVGCAVARSGFEFSDRSVFEDDTNEMHKKHSVLADEILSERRYKREAEMEHEDDEIELNPDEAFVTDEELLDEQLERMETDPMLQKVVLELNEYNNQAENLKAGLEFRYGNWIRAYEDMDPDDENAPKFEDMTLEEFKAYVEEYERQLAIDPSIAGPMGRTGARRMLSGNNDELANAFAEAQGTLETLSALNDNAQMLKRFTELKQLVSWMQPYDKRISRFCFYGCWCLPEGAHSFVAGEGRPVDDSDKACQHLWFCYTCAKQEFRGMFNNKMRECVPDKTKYKFKLRYKRNAKNNYQFRDISCTNRFYYPMNTLLRWRSNCAKAVCECDRGLAMNLYKAHKSWDKSRHRIWSQKVTNCKQLEACQDLPEGSAEKRECLSNGCLFTVKARCLNGDTGGSTVDHEQMCCGRYEDNGGRIQYRNHGGAKACCNGLGGYQSMMPWNGLMYNVVTHCCVQGKVKTAASGQCSNQ